VKKPYLVVQPDHSEKYRMYWYLPEDGDVGGVIGDIQFTEAALIAMTGEYRECAVAHLSAMKTLGVIRDRDGFWWESESAAKAALRIVKAALKADGGAPMPDWANKALAAGWKMPKGWKP
jgi:hypothetical protein